MTGSRGTPIAQTIFPVADVIPRSTEIARTELFKHKTDIVSVSVFRKNACTYAYALIRSCAIFDRSSGRVGQSGGSYEVAT